MPGGFMSNSPDTRSQSHYALWYWRVYRGMIGSKRFACNVIRMMKWFR